MKLLTFLVCMTLSGVLFAQDYTITEVLDQVIELEDNIIKYDITTYKVMEDINGVEFTVIDRVERIDLHQLEYDKGQLLIERAENIICNQIIEEEIPEIDKMINEIKEIKEMQ